MLNVSFSCGGKVVCELHTEGGCCPMEVGTQMLLVFLSIVSGLWELLTTSPVQGWSVLSFLLSLNVVRHAYDPPKCFWRFRWGKQLFILVGSHIAPENGQCSALHSATIAISFFLYPSSFSLGWEILHAHSLCSYFVFNETFGICKEYFVGISKCKFPCIVMRSAYYSNFCGLHCIGLNFDLLPLWHSFLATSESRPFHPSCVIDPKQEHGVNAVSYSWIKP